MKVGLSFVSTDNARANLTAEIPAVFDLEAVHTLAQREWSEYLNTIEIHGGTPAQRTIFYTGLYHMFLSPNIFSDRNGDYTGFDNQIHKARSQGGMCGVNCEMNQYANFSDWDIYRDVIQLQTLLTSYSASSMAQSLLNDAAKSGWLPRWAAANDTTYVWAETPPPSSSPTPSPSARATSTRTPHSTPCSKPLTFPAPALTANPNVLISPNTSPTATSPSTTTPSPPRAPLSMPLTTSPSRKWPAPPVTPPTPPPMST